VCSHVLASWSHLATWRGDPRHGLEYALAAQRWSRRTGDPLLSAYAHGLEAAPTRPWSDGPATAAAGTSSTAFAPWSGHGVS
jgi:hypothetical protein